VTRIFADTNIWLDFYQSSKTTLQIFTDLSAAAKQLLFTQQLTEEILRNRDRVITSIAERYRNPRLDLPTTSVVEIAPSYARMRAARSELGKASAEVADFLENLRDNSGDDPVLSALTALFIADGALVLPYNDLLVERANRRRLTGQPPGTSNGTLGDELHWEIILENLRDEDLLIVSRDQSFAAHFSLLATEFNAKTGGTLLGVQADLTSAMTKAAIAVPDSVRAAEDEVREGLRVDPDRWRVLSTRGDLALVTDGRLAGATPFRSHGGAICATCGYPGPWNGSRCLTCGTMSHD
jgi:hypothetical protein